MPRLYPERPYRLEDDDDSVWATRHPHEILEPIERLWGILEHPDDVLRAEPDDQ